MACKSFQKFFEEQLISYGPNSILRETCTEWLDLVRGSIASVASADGNNVRDFATTFLGAILTDSHSTFLQIGDGAIVVSDPDSEDDYVWVFWPESGEYANTTYFLTGDDAEEHVQFEIVHSPVNEVALFTDGVQRLAIQIASKQAHAPFFHTVFTPLRSELPGYSERVSFGLRQFLSSTEVNRRTDDDKTLVIATKRSLLALPLGS